MGKLHQAYLNVIRKVSQEVSPETLESFLNDPDRGGPHIAGVIREVAADVAAKLNEDRSEMLRARRESTAEFEAENTGRWSRMIDALETLVVVALEVGSDFNVEERPNAFPTNGYRVIALTSLHARACQVAQEVLVLLKSGFADGAHARWRSLHEIAVVTCVLAQEDEGLSERYLLHHNIDAFHAMLQYQKFAARLRQSPYGEEEMTSAQIVYDELVHRFGKSFSGPQGWASALLNKARPKIADLEKRADLDHLRPYYKMASQNVHAEARGLAFRLGQRPGGNVLIAGPSVYGLADPAHETGISLLQCTAALLNLKIDLDRLVILRVMESMLDEIGREAMEVLRTLGKRNAGEGS